MSFGVRRLAAAVASGSPPRTPHPPIINIQAQATYLSNCASKAIALGGKSPPRTKSQASCAP